MLFAPALADRAILPTAWGGRYFFNRIGHKMTFGFRPPRGEQFVIMLLGSAKKDATDFDLEAALNRLGFYRREES
ncbi:hypothetical protein [Pseudomonas aeruginosa]|uniref:hypothetical protein n=1 Tax=Pseudomonas aeruginosa TaxID=287 RepID=UPI0009A16F78|nr:hypothetical protein [Pseudomonas aeruginosa]